jgi:hypothetical protein
LALTTSFWDARPDISPRSFVETPAAGERLLDGAARTALYFAHEEKGIVGGAAGMTRKNVPVMCIFLLVVSVGAAAQTGLQEKLKTAYDYLDHKDFANSLRLFRELHTQVDRQSPAFADVAFGYSASQFYGLLAAMKAEDWTASIDLALGFLKTLDEDKDSLGSSVLEKKAWAIKDLIVAHFGLGQRDKAKPYRDFLYEAYRKNELPEGLRDFYNFEKFVHNGLNVWGYESFARLSDQPEGTSFSKHTYYVFSRDAEGNDKDPLFTVETVRVHKLTEDLPDYVLTKRVHSEGSVGSESYWTLTFDDPIDYEKLHLAVIAVLDGKVKPGAAGRIRVP